MPADTYLYLLLPVDTCHYFVTLANTPSTYCHALTPVNYQISQPVESNLSEVNLKQDFLIDGIVEACLTSFIPTQALYCSTNVHFLWYSFISYQYMKLLLHDSFFFFSI